MLAAKWQRKFTLNSQMNSKEVVNRTMLIMFSALSHNIFHSIADQGGLNKKGWNFVYLCLAQWEKPSIADLARITILLSLWWNGKSGWRWLRLQSEYFCQSFRLLKWKSFCWKAYAIIVTATSVLLPSWNQIIIGYLITPAFFYRTSAFRLNQKKRWDTLHQNCTGRTTRVQDSFISIHLTIS